MPFPTPEQPPSGQRPNASFGTMSERLTEEEFKQQQIERALDVLQEEIDALESLAADALIKISQADFAATPELREKASVIVRQLKTARMMRENLVNRKETR